MALFSALRSALSSFRGKPGEDGAERPLQKRAAADSGSEAILYFAATGEVIQARQALEDAGLFVRVMGPPPALRTGCDMVVVVPLLHVYAATSLLEKAGVPPLGSMPAGEGLLDPVSLFTVKDYGEWIMVRAANMKLTVEKAGQRVVNVSGGGCPDVPWLAACVSGLPLDGVAPVLKEHGQTLCGYALQLALDEMLRLRAEGGAAL